MSITEAGPIAPETTSTIRVLCPMSALATSFERVALMASKDGALPVLNAVAIEWHDNDRALLVATDSYMLGYESATDPVDTDALRDSAPAAMTLVGDPAKVVALFIGPAGQ